MAVDTQMLQNFFNKQKKPKIGALISKVSCEKNKKISTIKVVSNIHQSDTKQIPNRHQSDTIKSQNWYQSGNTTDTNLDIKLISKEYQTDTNTGFYSLTGLQKEIAITIYKLCQISRDKKTDAISIKQLADHCQSTTGAVKIAIYRLIEKNILLRENFKNGRGGWTVYSIPNNVYQDMFSLEAQSKLISNWHQSGTKLITKLVSEVIPTVSSSGGVLNILKETTTSDGNKNSFIQDLQEDWQLDIEPLQQIGFTQTHLKQIASQNKLPPQLVQDSIYGFAFDIENNDKLKKINKDPISYFMGIVRNGQVYTFSTNYESPRDKAMRLHLERTRELERKRTAMEKEAFDLAFRAWFSELSDAQKRELLPEKMRGGAKLEKNIFLESSARNKFETEVWPSKRKEITGFETTSKEEVEEEKEK